MKIAAIAAMLRVKNEARWLGEVLDSVRTLTEQIVVLNDHSTDETAAIAASRGAVIMASPFSLDTQDEARDKNCLLARTRYMFEPDYILCIDGDEVLEAGAADRIRAKLLPGIGVFSFPIRYLWNDRQHYRADGVYAKYARASMFSLIGAEKLEYRATKYGCNFHCGNIPHGVKGSGASVTADLLHLGYMHAEDRIRKYEWYNRLDPDNQYEDRYRHMVIGDLFPADSRFLHGGPLKIFTIPASKWPSDKALTYQG